MRSTDLECALGDIAELLERCGESFWRTKAQTALKRSDSSLIAEEVLTWFGGMGSLNDLILCEINGHAVKSSAYDEVNDQLDEARNKLFNLAKRVLERTR